MRSLRALVVVVSLSTVACLSDPIAPDASGGPLLPEPPTQTGFRYIHGTLIVSGTDDGDAVTLRPSAGEPDMQLIGELTSQMAQLPDGEVSVWGLLIAENSIVVAGYELMGMHGIPARDGVLIEVSGGYALERWNGRSDEVVNPPNELLTSLGLHVWLIGPYDQPPMEFGVFQDQ